VGSRPNALEGFQGAGCWKMRGQRKAVQAPTLMLLPFPHPPPPKPGSVSRFLLFLREGRGNRPAFAPLLFPYKKSNESLIGGELAARANNRSGMLPSCARTAGKKPEKARNPASTGKSSCSGSEPCEGNQDVSHEKYQTRTWWKNPPLKFSQLGEKRRGRAGPAGTNRVESIEDQG